MKTTRQQIAILSKLHPNWTRTQLAKAVKPPVTPQRVNQIINDVHPDFSSEEYKALNRHRYHKKAPKKYKRKDCKYCKGVSFTP